MTVDMSTVDAGPRGEERRGGVRPDRRTNGYDIQRFYSPFLALTLVHAQTLTSPLLKFTQEGPLKLSLKEQHRA